MRKHHPQNERIKCLTECRHAAQKLRIVIGSGHQHPDHPHAPILLRPRHERPRRRSAAEEGDKRASLHHHSMTSSARTSTVAGTSRPSALAVFMLMISATLVACWTGRSLGFSPLRMRPV